MRKRAILQPPHQAPPEFDEEMVWYSPELDELRVAKKSDGFVFMNEHGQFHCMYRLDGTGQIKTYDFYLIGSLEPKPADGRKHCHVCQKDVKVIEKMGGTICAECRVILGW